MSNRYVLVQWNRHKKVYDLLMLASMLAFLAAYIGIGMAASSYPPEVAAPTLVLRALGSLAIVMLHVILSIGPLCRLDDRFLPLLYNRRHMGVAFFLVVLLHFVIALGYYGGFGSQNPISAVLIGSGEGVPFEFYGFLALLIFAVMAATSHDFWLANLGPRFWKAMHMCIYAAYVLVLLHVVQGALQDRGGIGGPALLGLGAFWLCTIHIIAGLGECRSDRRADTPDEWVDVCSIDDIPASRARVVQVGESERIAIVKRQWQNLRSLKCLRASGRPAWRGAGYRWMPDVPLARISVRSCDRLFSAAVHGTREYV